MLNFMNTLITYLKGVKEELRHVVWPKSRTAVGHTILIILLSAITALFVGVADFLFTRGLSSVIGF